MLKREEREELIKQIVNCLTILLSRLGNDNINDRSVLILFNKILSEFNDREYLAIEHIAERLGIQFQFDIHNNCSVLCELDNEQLEVNLIVLFTCYFQPKCTNLFPNFENFFQKGKFNNTKLRL